MIGGFLKGPASARGGRSTALLFVVLWACLVYIPSRTVAQTSQDEATEAQSGSFGDFLALLKTDAPRTVVFRWTEPVELDGREQTLTGEQVRLESTGEVYTVFYDSDGLLLEEFSAQNQRRWPGGDVAPAGEKPTLQQAQAAQPKAALPPAGDLFTNNAVEDPAYYSQAILEPGLRDPKRRQVMRSRRGEVDPQALIDFSPVTGRTLKIDLFQDASVEAQFSRLQMNATGSFVLAGEVIGDPLSDVTMSVDGSAVAGRVRSPEHGLFLLRGTSGGGVEVMQVDATQFENCGSEPSLPPAASAASLAGTGGAAGMAASISASGGIGGSHVLTGERGSLILDSPPLGSGGLTMDILVGYTNAAEAQVAEFIVDAGGDIDGFAEPAELMRALIHMEVFDANTAYLNSGVNHRLRLVHIFSTAYVESGSSSADLGDLADVGGDALDVVHTYRDFFGADFVHLITAPPVPDVCGIAYIRQSIDDFSALAFGITLADCFGVYVLAHEVGHNQGCAHDRGNNPIGAGPTEQFGTGLNQGYSYGYVFKGNSGNLFETIMAQTLLSPLGPIPHFSNPDVLFDGVPTGLPVGDPKAANNALTINISAPSSATWQSTQPDGRQIASLSSVGLAGNALDTVMTAGLIIQENVADGPGVMKKVLIRGRGASLSGLGLGTLLGDPKLTLLQSTLVSPPVVAQNNDWKDTQEAEITATGLQPSNDSEAAILTYLAPGSYAAVLEDEGGSPGFGAIEAFILDDHGRSAKPFILSSISTIDVGHEEISGEFQVKGPDPSNIVVRARGRSLADENPADPFTDLNTLADPTIEIYSGPTLIAQNDDWFSTQLDRIVEVGARPADDRDAVVRLYLQPGTYRAVMKRFGTTVPGAGILEVVDVNNASAALELTSSTILNFGSVTQGQSVGTATPYTFTVGIASVGSAALHIPTFDWQLGDGFNTGFVDGVSGTRYGQVPITIDPGTTLLLPFTFTGLTTGPKSRNIFLPTNDMGNPQITITLQANVLAAPGGGAGTVTGLFVTPTTLAWGKVALGNVVTKTVRIQNFDSVPRQINAFASQFSKKDKYFSTTAGKTATVLQPGTFVDIPFTYKAMRAGTTTKKTVKLTTSDPALPTVSIQLSATAVMTF